ncbi:aggregation-promoting factor C-terminal-like domain-containing protein [Actinorugispora endophytica]|uniref:aggregation-promoting factor C-terminal-like domain-containing protein n=1 Tax=Actinorugispora endophytica TaxID=1605990 RepID=UPI00105F0904|nr:lytic transglycosylase domain-containing protein [Actinorugispora endophytica]
MLKNRISLRVATAAGAAAVVVAGTAFGVSAFADVGAGPDQTASVAVLPGVPEAEETPFFPEPEADDAESRQTLLQDAGSRRDQVVGSGSVSTEGSLEQEKEEEEEEEEETSSGGGGAAVPAGSSKEIALQMLPDYGWGEDQFSGCLEPLWEKESNWNHLAENPSSGAYGIPQSLPGDKMASAGSDWQTNPATQIKWGLGYIQDRYGSPCEAWAHSQSVGWY